MAQSSSQNADSKSGEACAADPSVLSGEACVKCGFKCIQGCV